eukprot:6186091-Pleurochrysis_carterae.AAC.4
MHIRKHADTRTVASGTTAHHFALVTAHAANAPRARARAHADVMLESTPHCLDLSSNPYLWGGETGHDQMGPFHDTIESRCPLTPPVRSSTHADYTRAARAIRTLRAR